MVIPYLITPVSDAHAMSGWLNTNSFSAPRWRFRFCFHPHGEYLTELLFTQRSVPNLQDSGASDFRKLWPKSTAIPRRRSIKKKVQQWESKNGDVPQ